MDTLSHTSSTIQNELHQFFKWQKQGDGIKASLFNLIVYTHEARRTHYFKELVKIIRSQFPCRIIFIVGNPHSGEDRLHLQVYSEKTHGEHKIVCDQIFIEASGEGINRVKFILPPLFVPDLPIYLLWGQDPMTEQTILPYLEDYATRLIFDSESSEDLQQFSEDMLSRIHSTSVQIIDMNWARIGGWREILAQVFDSPERLQQLGVADSILIIYNSVPSKLLFHPDTQAIYLQAWLASCLGWEYQKSEKENKSQIIYYRSGERSRRVELIPQNNEQFQSEEILGMKVGSIGDYDCHLERISLDQVKVSASDRYQCKVPFILLMPNLRSGRNFMQEIFYQKPSDRYEAMLNIIRGIK